MRGLVLLFLLFIGISSLILFINISDLNNKENNQKFEFSTFTSAVCENKEGAVYCRDELFVNCNGNISKADGVAECGGITQNVPKVTGFAVFDEGWKDPRE